MVWGAFPVTPPTADSRAAMNYKRGIHPPAHTPTVGASHRREPAHPPSPHRHRRRRSGRGSGWGDNGTGRRSRWSGFAAIPPPPTSRKRPGPLRAFSTSSRNVV